MQLHLLKMVRKYGNTTLKCNAKATSRADHVWAKVERSEMLVITQCT